MRFWTKISRMFLFCVFGIDYFKAKKKCVFYNFTFRILARYGITMEYENLWQLAELATIKQGWQERIQEYMQRMHMQE